MKTKYFIYAICLAALPLLASCSDDDFPTEVKPAATGTFTDADGREYRTVKYGQTEWMAENYRGGDPWVEQSYLTDNGLEYWFEDDFDIDEEEELLEREGNYMNYQQALDNCPEGWRLPTDDDWKQLETLMGVSDVDATGWRAGGGVPMMAVTGLHLTLRGALHALSTSRYVKCNVGDFGYYWTATKDTSMTTDYAYIRKVMYCKNQVMRISMPTKRFAMVRYIKK